MKKILDLFLKFRRNDLYCSNGFQSVENLMSSYFLSPEGTIHIVGPDFNPVKKYIHNAKEPKARRILFNRLD